MCNGCNWNNGSSCGSCNACNAARSNGSCNSSCCCQNSLWNVLFGNTQRVCRNSYGNLVVNNASCGCSASNSCWNNRCGNGYLSSAAVDNGYTCADNACQNYDSGASTSYTSCSNGCNATSYNRCGCNAYAAWTQENYGE